MPAALPDLTLPDFASEIRGRAPEALADTVVQALHAYYRELRRWAPRLALIGRGTLDEVLDRHFGESLAALPLIPPRPGGEIVDVGSGAGFPGLVLAAARPGWRVTLVEARERKWAFLESVRRKAALDCRCLNARVGHPLPDGPLPEGLPAAFDVVTARAIRLDAATTGALLARLTPRGRALFWAGEADPDLPGSARAATVARLPGSERRRIVAVRPEIPGTQVPEIESPQT
ncbi:MAG TPA: RsmG family class I SAM-dependent methyltransferase [Thermoanaerobaculia bacterium]|nr:RsmG family class I SAM-dependent methyltransferase [Thermoanaerobaculia bacterium]